MKKGSTLKILKSNPYAGINRIRLLGYNLSPSSGHPFFIRGAKVMFPWRKALPFNFFYFATP